MTALPPELTRMTELDDAWAVACPGARLDAVRRAARPLKDRLHSTGTASCVRTHDLITFPYPTAFGLAGAAYSPAPFVMMRNRVQLVQIQAAGRVITILVNPSDPERSMKAPVFARQIERYGRFLSRRVMSTRHGRLVQALELWGVAPEQVDDLTFDHLHVQDVRGLLGTDQPEPGQNAPTAPLLPNARRLAQADELRTLACLHPLQAPWYVADGLTGVPSDRIIALD